MVGVLHSIVERLCQFRTLTLCYNFKRIFFTISLSPFFLSFLPLMLLSSVSISLLHYSFFFSLCSFIFLPYGQFVLVYLHFLFTFVEKCNCIKLSSGCFSPRHNYYYYYYSLFQNNAFHKIIRSR